MIYTFSSLISTPDIYIMVPPPIFRPGWGVSVHLLNNYIPNIVLPKIGKMSGRPLINVFRMISGDNLTNAASFYYNSTQSGCLNDGLHLTDYGYARVALSVASEFVANNESKHVPRSTRHILKENINHFIM